MTKNAIIAALLLVGTARAQLQCSGSKVPCCPDGSALDKSASVPCSSGRPVCASSCGSSSASSVQLCDACGASATYSEVISTESSLSKRTITSSGCPNHYSVCTGKSGVPGCGSVGEEGTATEAKDQSKTYEVPGEPVLASSNTDIECDMGAIGIALNGVSIYGGSVDTSCTLLDVDDTTSEWTAFDMCSGHSEMTGDYHYHFPPSCLIAQALATSPYSNGHSPQVGWAQDGFPIYGPKYNSSKTITQADLDDCSGREEELPDIDNFK